MYRLIKIGSHSKRPIEKNWQTSANYAWDDPSLQEHLSGGGNYGIICGPGGLRVFDADELERLRVLGVLDKLPETFTVQSSPGHEHRYYHIPELEKKRVLTDPILKGVDGNPKHLGELQGPGTQVIGPGSNHPNGHVYAVLKDLPIIALTLEQIEDALTGLQTEDSRAEMVRVDDDPLRAIPIEDIAYPAGVVRRLGNEIQGSHPVHGSTTGHNFRIDPVKNAWRCDRCQSGGGPALWLAVKHNILPCKDARPGALRGEDFKRVVEIAEEVGLIPKSEHSDELAIEDVSEISIIKAGPNKGHKKISFDPDKAADAVIQHFHIISTPDERIWIYKDGIYVPDGANIIDQLLDRIAGNLYNTSTAREVKRKIVLRTLESEGIFDANPYHLCVKNGVVNLRTGEFTVHKPSYYMTMKAPIVYNPKAKCPNFLKFLDGACSSDLDKITLIDWIVACACQVCFEYILFLLGHGSNGKHVYEEFLRSFFGSEAAEAISFDELVTNRFAMANLKRARFCIGTETNPSKAATEQLKRISGGDWLSGDIKNVQIRQKWRPTTQLIFDTNSMPIFEDVSYGFTRRFTRVNMPFRFVDNPDPNEPLEKKKDPDMLAKITTEEELSGVLNIVIMRAIENIPARAVLRRLDDFAAYEQQCYSVNDFIERFLIFAPDRRLDPEYHEPVKHLYDMFQEYAKYIVGAKVSRRKFALIVGKENGEPSMTIKYFGVAVRGFRGLKFDEIAFNAFTNDARRQYSNGCRSQERLDNASETNSGNSIVTLVTLSSYIYKEIIHKYSIYYIRDKAETPKRYAGINQCKSAQPMADSEEKGSNISEGSA